MVIAAIAILTRVFSDKKYDGDRFYFDGFFLKRGVFLTKTIIRFFILPPKNMY